MAIKATGQVTIIDVTDAYSVILTSEAYTFVGNTSGAPAGLKCATQAVAYCGSNQCSVVNVDQKAIIKSGNRPYSKRNVLSIMILIISSRKPA